jgi:hypothetical protein
MVSGIAAAQNVRDLDAMDRTLASLAGKTATNCGTVEEDADPTRSNSCAHRAFRHQTPFYVRYSYKGYDSFVADGISLDHHGKLRFVKFDPVGFSAKTAHVGKLTNNNEIYILECPRPYRLIERRRPMDRAPKDKRLTCLRPYEMPL